MVDADFKAQRHERVEQGLQLGGRLAGLELRNSRLSTTDPARQFGLGQSGSPSRTADDCTQLTGGSGLLIHHVSMFVGIRESV